MKVVLFCGGQGTRLRDYSERVPKPLVPIGGLPILWHIMEYYAAFGHRDFVLCLGYKGETIRRFFRDLRGARARGPGPAEAGARLDAQRFDIGDWSVTLVDTGQTTSIGGRLLRVRELVETEETFLCNYADVLADLDLDDMAAGFRASGAVAGFCAVAPPYSCHVVSVREDGGVDGMSGLQDSGMLINGGYMMLKPGIFDNLREGEELVVEGFARLIAQGRLYGHRHDGFWMPMDTFKERQALDAMLAQGIAPWQPDRRRRHAESKVA